MKYAKILLLVVLLFGLSGLGIRRIVSGRNTGATIPPVGRPSDAAQGTSPAPFGIFPQREQFVTEEDNAFIVNVAAECPIGTSNTAKIELLPPTPRFVSTGFPCRCENC